MSEVVTIKEFVKDAPSRFRKTATVYEMIRKELLPRGVVIRVSERRFLINKNAFRAWLEDGGNKQEKEAA